MKGFGIEVKNTLLDPKHIEAMGVAVWLYMWCLDKITSISEEGVGLVLGGKPIKYSEVSGEMGLSERTYSRWVSILAKESYINTKRTPYGIIFSVNKAFKRFGKRIAKNGVSAKKEVSQERRIPEPKMAELGDKNGVSNKTESVDTTGDNGEGREETPGDFSRRFFQGDKSAVLPLANKLTDDGVPKEVVIQELLKFKNYWTEPTKNGKKARWELEKTFEVKRRLATWFRNAAERSGGSRRSGAGVTI